VYAYGSAGQFPTSTYQNSNFWVDAVFSPQPSSPPAVSSVTPVAGSSSNPVSTDPSVTFTEPVVTSTASVTVKDPNGNAVAGSTTFNGAGTVATFTPGSSLAAGTAYTVTVSGAQNSAGQTMTPYSYTFTTSQVFDAGGQCPCTVWPDVAPSSATDANDPSNNNIGVQFTANAAGSISGIRFFKEPDDTGSHTGYLWSAGGALLASGTFTGESTTGWEQLTFATPVPVTAGTTYIASYSTSTGHYAFTDEGLSSPVTNGPLTAVQGVYAYGSAGQFPTSTYQNSNFWVDAVFAPA
jgi:hypothetical protein